MPVREELHLSYSTVMDRASSGLRLSVQKFRANLLLSSVLIGNFRHARFWPTCVCIPVMLAALAVQSLDDYNPNDVARMHMVEKDVEYARSSVV